MDQDYDVVGKSQNGIDLAMSLLKTHMRLGCSLYATSRLLVETQSEVSARVKLSLVLKS